MQVATPDNQSYPNQSRVTIHKRRWEGYYLMIGFEEIQMAASDLTHSGLKLYLYLAQNVDEYEFLLSPKDVMNHYPMSKSSFDRAKKELIEKGYMVQNGNNSFAFYANKEDSSFSIRDKEKEISNILGTYMAIFGEDAAKKKLEEVKQIKNKYSDSRKQLNALYADFYNKLLKEISEQSKNQFQF